MSTGNANTPIRKNQGGAEMVIASGGSIEIESGGSLVLDAGATFTNAVVGNNVKVKKIASITGTASEQDTGWDLPTRAVVLDVFICVTTAQSGKTLDVGTLSSESGGDADGFLKGVSLASLGLVRGVATLTTGSNEVYFASTTRGALFAALTAGTDAAGDVGTYYEKPYLTDGATAKSITCTGSSGTSTAVFDIYVVYIDVVA